LASLGSAIKQQTNNKQQAKLTPPPESALKVVPRPHVIEITGTRVLDFAHPPTTLAASDSDGGLSERVIVCHREIEGVDAEAAASALWIFPYASQRGQNHQMTLTISSSYRLKPSVISAGASIDSC
jgi:hypothetical protein